MVDEDTAQAAVMHLRTATAELMEDALIWLARAIGEPGLGEHLAELGADLAKLGAAAEVLTRRSGGGLARRGSGD